jgi:hypothetical protein
VPIADIAKSPARVEERIKKTDDGSGGIIEQKVKFPIWFEPTAKGITPMGTALDTAAKLLTEWVDRHKVSYPPIVINISDGEATDSGPVPQAQALTGLATDDGNVLLLNCHISSKPLQPIVFPDRDDDLPDDFAKTLFSISSVLPPKMQDMARAEGFDMGVDPRGFAFNADLVELIRFLDIGTRASNV